MCSDHTVLPQWANWLIRRLIPAYGEDTALGDYAELYGKQYQTRGPWFARRWLLRQLQRAICPLILQKMIGRIQMLINGAKLAFRNARKRPFYSLINVLGLAVGMAVFGLMALYVRHELSYDRHHVNADRIHRVIFTGVFGGEGYQTASVAAVTVTALRADFLEVEAATRIYAKPEPVFRRGETAFKETRFAYVDSSFFKVFTLPLLFGDPQTALTQPHSLLLSADAAQKYFGTADPIGQSLHMDDGADYRVTGVYQPMPETGHFQFDLMASLGSIPESQNPLWLDHMVFHTYCLLRAGAAAADLEAKFPAMVNQYVGAMFAQSGRSLDEMRAAGNDFAFGLQPLSDIHLHSHRLEELAVNGDARTVAIFSVIAFFVLVIACVNFMNLSTARSLGRAREVGVRKALGGQRGELRRQFLSESLAISGLALILALGLMVATLPLFCGLSGRQLALSSFWDGGTLLGFLALWVFVALISGSYPALFLAGIHPVTVFRQRVAARSTSKGLRDALVVLQFLLSVVLAAGALVVQHQWRYIQKRNLGYNRAQLLYIENGAALGSRAPAFKERLQSLPAVQFVSLSDLLPVGDNKYVDVMCPEGRYRQDGTPVTRWAVDADFQETYDMSLLSGRFFSVDHGSEGYNVVVNESAVRFFGWENALGMRIFDGRPPHMEVYTVIGVVKDFHYESMRSPIDPLAMISGEASEFITVRLAPGQVHDGVAAVREAWEAFAPSRLFNFGFVDQQFEAAYRSERREGQIFALFAGLAVFIGSLGLLGLVAFAAEQRTKEIGIRKVLGASAGSVIMLLGREFGRLVLIAFALGAPLAYGLMRRWLDGFSYRVPLTAFPFFLAGLLAASVAGLTIGVLAVRAARMNPVKSLRHE